jgi:hypothetical protein
MDEEEDGYDPVWENTLQNLTDGDENETEGWNDNIGMMLLVRATEDAGFYEGTDKGASNIEGNVHQAGDEDTLTAKTAMKSLSKRR